MARKTNSSSGIGIIILIIGLLFMIMATYLMGAILFLTWIFYEIRHIKIRKAIAESFFPTDQELKELRQQEAEYDAIITEMNSIDEIGSELSKRKDGYFQERSNLGKELNIKLQPLVSRGKQLQTGIQKIQERPFERFMEWIKIRTKKVSLRYAIGILLVSFIYFISPPEWALAFSTKSTAIIQEFTSIEFNALTFAQSGLPIWISVIMFFLIQPFARKRLLKKYNNVMMVCHQKF